MAVRPAQTTTKTPQQDDPNTSDESQQEESNESQQEESNESQQKPTQDPASSSVSDSVALPDAPYDQEELEDLAVSLQRNGPFFLGNDVRSRESSLGVAKSILDSVVAMGWEKPTIKSETKEAIQSVYKADEDARKRDKEKDMFREGRPNEDVPTTEDKTRNRPQTGPTPDGSSSVPGALEDNPRPTDAGGESASTTSSTDPSRPPTSGEQSTSASEAETSNNP